MSLQKNTILQNGKYKIINMLGQGGFGITYLAKQKVSITGALGAIDAEIDVTIKEFFMKDFCNREEGASLVTIPSTGSTQLVEKFRQKFIKEAQNISKLDHPNIIKVLDVFKENGTAYYVMEYIGGGSLLDLIKKNNALNESDTLFYTKKIASALQYIHERNMNHLDVKPANVLLRNNGDIVLIDFGLSKNYDATGEQTTSTPIGVSVGYAPIEQSRIGGVGMFSPATDIYSLGATMYKMLTGITPLEASVIIDEGLPEMPSTISSQTRYVIEKAMQPRRKDRYQSIDDFLEALTDSNVSEPIKIEKKSETIVDRNESAVEDLTSESIATNNIKEDLELPKPKFLKEEGKEETTMLITDYMVQTSDIDSSEIVDLGLSVKWCGHNLGVSLPEEYGDYYRWADGMNDSSLNIMPTETEISGTSFDVASNLTNGKFRTPTRKEFKELIDHCRWSWVEYKGVNGCKVTGPSGKSIFLPSAGRKSDYGIYRKEVYGYYWSSTKSHSLNAYYLYFNDKDSDIQYEPISTLRTIRPVVG